MSEGPALQIYLIKTSLSPFDKNLANQILSRFCKWILDQWIFSGKPREVPMPPSLWIPKVVFTEFRFRLSTSWQTLLRTWQYLTVVPKPHHKRRRILIFSWPWDGSALQKMRLSSANNRWEVDGLALEIWRPCICPFLRFVSRASVHRIKRNGEIGSPC